MTHELQDSEVLGVVAAGRLVGVKRQLAYRLAATGDLPTLRLGRKLVVPRKALEELLTLEGVERFRARRCEQREVTK